MLILLAFCSSWLNFANCPFVFFILLACSSAQQAWACVTGFAPESHRCRINVVWQVGCLSLITLTICTQGLSLPWQSFGLTAIVGFRHLQRHLLRHTRSNGNPNGGYRGLQVCAGHSLSSFGPFYQVNFNGLPAHANIDFAHVYVMPGRQQVMAMMPFGVRCSLSAWDLHWT